MQARRPGVNAVLAENLVQIAGIGDEAEANMLQRCGVRYLGFPLRLPVRGEDITEKAASLIIRRLEPPVFGVLITYLHQAREIAELCSSLGTRIVQLHGDIELEQLSRLRAMHSSPTPTILQPVLREPRGRPTTGASADGSWRFPIDP